MDYFNYVGLVIMFLIMIPNLAFMINNKEGLKNLYNNKVVNVFEGIGRYGSFILMCVNIPYTYFNFWFSNAFIVYIVVNGVLVLTYLLTWMICFNKHILVRAYICSIVPSVIFIFSGIMLLNIPLIVFALIFSVFHIYLTLKNTYLSLKEEDNNKEIKE